MDIFVRNVPTHATQKQVNACFAAPLAQCGIQVYHCQVLKGKPLAIITVLDIPAGQRFLSWYGLPQSAPSNKRPMKQILFHQRTYLRCEKSRNNPGDLQVKALIYEASQLSGSATVPPPPTADKNKNLVRFAVSALHCGTWSYEQSRLTYNTQFTRNTYGTITFGLKEAILILGDPGGHQFRMELSYSMCEHILLGDYRNPTVTFSLMYSPKFYEVQAEDDLVSNLMAMSLGPDATKKKSFVKSRITGIDSLHKKIAGACRVYRVNLVDWNSLGRVRSLLNSAAKTASPLSHSTPLQYPQENHARVFMRLQNEIGDTGRYGSMPFQIRYQIERLARNGILSPEVILELLPKILDVYRSADADSTAHALGRMCKQLPPPGPDVDANELSLPALKAYLEAYAKSYEYYSPSNPYELSKRYQHINLIHKAIVTPTGFYLEGPEPEPTNRVLRRYGNHTDHFIRVVFLDEDGSNVRYDPRASQYNVYHERFKQVLDGTSVIASKGFSFLGFSHSSLRSQSCWFMAPMIRDGHMLYSPQILRELGDFSNIRTPAKCAARIGQNFTDTNATVDLSPRSVHEIPVIERNGRDFSDGVGTISYATLCKIWRVYGTKRALKPTVLQIRFQGAKGMVSLDTRIQGEQLRLRSNMRKFETESSWNLEICGAAFRTLPMILNRQFIKILEDLGVHTDTFLDLQEAATARLRMMTESSVNTATFLEEVNLSKATQMPSLITLLGEVGLNYHSDNFLYSVVEMAVVTKLREIKYRGRIPVPDGMTLYGIMDETGFLQEGEIFVITERQPSSSSRKHNVFEQPGALGGKQVLVRDRVVITRSPAMHPGDVQLVNAVNVPEDSPLQELRNVIVFSQHGARDLPSQLSGGDLDGDLYNVIYDPRLIPRMTYVAADYPRVPPIELDRDVTGKDMSDFFVTFMESDQLGMICNIHQQLADESQFGTLDPRCIQLANMASTAVDFSKTGIPVNMRECPKYNKIRPDFMAPSPRIYVSEAGALDLEEMDTNTDDAFDDINAERPQMRYYKSEKVLGQLYRNIDERHILENMQHHHRAALHDARAANDLLNKLSRYMQWYAKQYGVLYDNYKPLARDIRHGYEDCLLDILYTYSPSVHSPLSEPEVFSGTILGRQGGAQGKPLRELSKTMRERFEVVCEYAVLRIVQGDAAMQDVEYLDALYDLEEREIEALPRAIACLLVAVGERSAPDRRLGELKSFAYVAAGVCLRELHRWRSGLGQYGSLPRFKEGMMG